MNIRTILFSIAACAAAVPAVAQEEDACTVPGILVSEDAAGDGMLSPAGQGFGDILTIHMAEPGGGGQLVITYRMADLATLPPNTAWLIRFLTDALPSGTIQEFFVGMVTGPDATPHLVHGIAENADPAGQAGLMFVPQGALGEGSGFDADGTLTLVLDKSAVDGLEPGGAIYGMIPLVHRITPTDGSQGFAYGFRSLSDVLLAYDEAPDGFYEILGEDCGDAKSFLGVSVGALPPHALLLLTVAALAGLRRFVQVSGDR